MTSRSPDARAETAPLPSTSAKAKGLANRTAEYNCFLNVVLQALWQIDPVRAYFLEGGGSPRAGAGTDSGSPVLDAIATLFANYEFGEDRTLPPLAVRAALAALYDGRRFKMDEMDDAAEVLDAILREMHGGVDIDQPCRKWGPGGKCLGHRVFALETVESRECATCAASSGCDAASCDFVYRVWAGDLLRVQRAARGALTLASAIRAVNRSTRPNVPCPARCFGDEPVAERRVTVLNDPAALCVSVVWAPNPTLEERANVIAMLDPTRTLDLAQCFYAPSAARPASYVLVGFVAYYGAHFVYFRNAPAAGEEWIQMDDAEIKPVGSWPAVSERCVRGGWQPVLLFFARIPSPESGDGGQCSTT